MRIAVNAIMDSAKSGAWHVLKNIIFELKEIDIENEYILYVEKSYDGDLGVLPENFRIIRTRVSSKSPLLRIIWDAFILPLRLIKNKVDVLYLPSHSAALLIKVKPVVLTIHDLTEYQLKQHYSKSRMLYRKLMLPISTRLADRIITVSEYTKNEIIRILKVDEQKISILHNAANGRFKTVNHGTCKKVLENKHKITFPFLLYIGQIQHPNKNLVGLLHAFARIKPSFDKPYKLVFVGKEHLSSEIVYKTAGELNLTKDVVFTGYVPTEDLPFFYNAAEVFVYPSLYEGFGIPVVEAMACGCPVITSNRSSLPEVSGDAGLLVDPDDVDEIAEAMLKVLTDSAKREQMIEKGFEQIKKFSWKDSAKKTIDIFESISK